MTHPYRFTIGGAQVSGEQTFDVVNPSTGEVFAQAPAATAAHVDAAFDAAQRAFPAWAADAAARRKALHAVADATEAAVDEVAHVLSLENGKPFTDSQWEIKAAAAWFRYYADFELAPEEIVQDGYRATVFRRPLGVVAAIKPWNTPLIQFAWPVAPALRAGNTIVLKPSPFTPLSTLLLAERVAGAAPAGVINVVAGPDPLGAALTGHPVPRKVSFTGSTATGRKVAQAAAADLKRFTLELGGNDAALVLPDADIATVAPGVFWAAFMNNGQICGAVKRVYVHESRQAELVEALADIARSVKIGEPWDEGVQLGPVSTRPQFERVTSLLSDALANGARAASGGAPLDRPGFFLPPTILDHVDDGLAIVDEEQFGPVLPVVSYQTVDDAVARANNSPYGLDASVWGADTELATRVATRLEAGVVTVNQHSFGARPDLPYGGHKASGFGVENGHWGIEEYTQIQAIGNPEAAPRPSSD
ncbi:acyl-CoA reductase-like NAD-dependent aldehyde dehydrogenase [Actinocorallia herbida]|uniref:Acyl-CoA reductase-like NAD-dependent aldehyde dehydrogenase n=1 Tax=Actinocorallia herbida TaxID=58109 RepID=A0A3N1CWJ5_9ACTN|nr:aldehyde dehydrogenase family protein [Actinocorallia herbida]ROO85663.1 acyl-CoA reductase-like NAD-dependent aldehyde dehydrogenase [Actinocorallia herbida]